MLQRDEVRVAVDGAGCLVGLSGSVVVRRGGDEVELKMGQAVVLPVGDVVVASAAAASFMRCVAPA